MLEYFRTFWKTIGENVLIKLADDRSVGSTGMLVLMYVPGEAPLRMTGIDPVALALLNEKGNQFGGGGGWLFPTVPGTPGFTNGTPNYGPLVPD